jgi:hypothetical protein
LAQVVALILAQTSALIGSTAVPVLAQAASPMIEFGPAKAGTPLTIERLLESPVYRQNQALIQAMASQQLAASGDLSDEVRATLAQTLNELPFHRVADVEVSFLSGIPDLVGLCLEGFPTNNLAIEACASTAIFVSSLVLNVKYRWDLVLKQNEKGRIHNLQLGPGGGVRYVEGLCFDACQNPTVRADLMASLEYTYWLSHHLGIQTQLDAGIDFHVGTINNGYANDAMTAPIIPFGKITVGIAF